MAGRDDFDFLEEGIDEENQETGEENQETGEPSEISPEENGQSDAQQRDKKPFNLFENPDFKAFQSAKDREIAELRNQFKRDAEERERLLLARMNDKEKQEYGTSKIARENQELRQRLEETETLAYRAQKIADLRAETGAPLDAIDMSSEAAAIRSAYQWKLNNSQQDDRPRRRTDLGSGNVTRATPADKLRKAYQAALKGYDAKAMARIADEAYAAGVDLHGD